MKQAPSIPYNSNDFDKIYKEFKWNVPEYLNLGYDLCDKHGDEPDKVAVFFEDEKGKEQKLTFGELIKFSNKFANVLKEVGVGQGDRVSLIMGQRAETVIAQMAIFKLGAILLPLSVLFQYEALEFRLHNSEAKAVVIHEDDADKIRNMRSKLPNLKKVVVIGKALKDELDFWNSIKMASSKFKYANTRSEDPALLIYTSGTTGNPKGALHAHRFMIGNYPSFEMTHNFFPKEKDVFWSPADWAWGGGLFDALFPCLHYGIPILAFREPKFDPEKVLEMLNKYRVTCTFIWPTGLKMMRQIKGIKSKYPDINMRSISSGGESVGEETIKWAQENLNVTINEFFGQTEINYVLGNCSAIMKIKAGSMGKPMPGHIVELMDEEGNIINKSGVAGEVVSKRPDPGMMLGYFNNEKATKDKFSGDWWKYGDKAHKDEDGYYWFEGRDDDIIGSSGYRIGPSEIENCLLQHPSVANAAVVGSPDEVRGEIVKAFIVLAEGFKPSEDLKKELQDLVRKNLAFYEYPREVEFIDKMPMTTTGKVQRIVLKKLEIERKKKK